jgi:hypothetical protein
MNHTAQNGQRHFADILVQPKHGNRKKLLVAILFVLLGIVIAYQHMKITKQETELNHSLPTGTQSGSCDPVLKRVCG